jgi:hypothetical protein
MPSKGLLEGDRKAVPPKNTERSSSRTTPSSDTSSGGSCVGLKSAPTMSSPASMRKVSPAASP